MNTKTSAWQRIRTTWTAARARRPAPWPVEYVQCSSCGKIGYRVAERMLLSQREGEDCSTPTEYQCPLCQAYSIRIVGDEPGAEQDTATCSARLGAEYLFARCGASFAVPADATAVICPVCGDRQHR